MIMLAAFNSSKTPSIKYLAVGGGGAACYSGTIAYGAGGGGAVVEGTVAVSPQTAYAITVGQGGTRGFPSGGRGGSTSIGSLVVVPGGFGGTQNLGGNSGNGNLPYQKAGGGSAGAAYQNLAGVINNGGPGVVSSITGKYIAYGQGGREFMGNVTAAIEKTTGFGADSYTTIPAYWTGAGDNGLVVISYPNTYPAPNLISGATDISSGTPGFRTYMFVVNGSISF